MVYPIKSLFSAGIMICSLILASCHTIEVAEPTAPRTVSDWMELTARHRTDIFSRTVETARTDTMVALAMFEAANAIEQAYPSQLGFEPASEPADLDVAVTTAAFEVLRTLYKEDEPTFALAYEKSLSGRRPDPEYLAAQKIGRRAANSAIKRGQLLRVDERAPFRTTTPAGAYIPEGTPSLITDFDLALAPWALSSPGEARPGPPPPLSSTQYAIGLNEVRQLGALEGHLRSAEQSETARFWFLIDMNPILREIAEQEGRSVTDNTRLYAMFYMAADDAWLVSSEAKVHYQYWRPVTAIRSADRDGNEETVRDAYWQPFMATPPHPEYPCAHCVQASALAAIIEAELADPSRTFTFRSTTLPDAQPRRITLSDYVAQTSLSRIYAGAHYRFSNTAGENSGRAVASAVLERWSEER